MLKVACNHLINTTMALKPLATSETSWCWVANDLTDSEPRTEQFAIKFKVSSKLFIYQSVLKVYVAYFLMFYPLFVLQNNMDHWFSTLIPGNFLLRSSL